MPSCLVFKPIFCTVKIFFKKYKKTLDFLIEMCYHS